MSRFNSAVTDPTMTTAPAKSAIPLGAARARWWPAAANSPSSSATRPINSSPATRTNGGQSCGRGATCGHGMSEHCRREDRQANRGQRPAQGDSRPTCKRVILWSLSTIVGPARHRKVSAKYAP